MTATAGDRTSNKTLEPTNGVAALAARGQRHWPRCLLIMRSSIIAACHLFLVACSSTASDRVYPLVVGVTADSALTRVDIDERNSGPPPLGFEVDCKALPYANGEERDFCYKHGSWAVAHHERGIVVACSCGEFGGFVSWYGKDGAFRQTLVAGEVPRTLVSDDEALLCITGISHLSISEGSIRAFRLVGDVWQPVGPNALARQADSVRIEPDGSVVLELLWDGGTFRYRAGVLEQLPSSSPADAPMQPTGASCDAGGERVGPTFVHEEHGHAGKS